MVRARGDGFVTHIEGPLAQLDRVIWRRSGLTRLIIVTKDDEYLQLKSSAAYDFAKAVDAPLDPDFDGQSKAVRLNIYHGIFGTRLAVEDGATGKFDYFQKSELWTAD